MTLIETFEYILESKRNGNHTQARELFFSLSAGMQGNKAEFFRYMEENYYADEMAAYDRSPHWIPNPIDRLKAYLYFQTK